MTKIFDQFNQEINEGDIVSYIINYTHIGSYRHDLAVGEFIGFDRPNNRELLTIEDKIPIILLFKRYSPTHWLEKPYKEIHRFKTYFIDEKMLEIRDINLLKITSKEIKEAIMLHRLSTNGDKK